MKIALILIICLIVILIGLRLSNQYTQKAKFYASLLNLLEDIRLNISFKKDKIDEILDGHKDNPNIKQFIKCFKTYLDGGKIDLSIVSVIDFDDLPDLTAIVENIGHYNATTELIQLNNFIDRTKVKANAAEDDRKKFAPMIVKLSVLLSLAVGIILI